MQESRRKEGGALKENTDEREETAGKRDSERGEITRYDREEKRDIFCGAVAVAWSAEPQANVSVSPGLCLASVASSASLYGE